MQDSSYEFLDDPVRFKSKGFPLARSVMASSCVPFAFTPVTIDKEFFEFPQDALLFHPILLDVGVYDNQVIHKVMQQGRFNCLFVIASDAGTGAAGELRYRNTISLLVETMNVFMSRIKKIQMMRNVYDNANTAGKEVAYFSLGWNIENCIPGFIKNLEKKQITQTVIDAHQLKAAWITDPKHYETEITTHLRARTGYETIYKPSDEEKRIARNVGTNLTALSTQEVNCLIRQAEALTELQAKLYCPSLF
jgi:NTE family protein